MTDEKFKLWQIARHSSATSSVWRATSKGNFDIAKQLIIDSSPLISLSDFLDLPEPKDEIDNEVDELMAEVLKLQREGIKLNPTLLQKRLKIGWGRAKKLINKVSLG